MKKFTLYALLFTLCMCTGCTQQVKWRIGVSQCSDDDWRDKVNAEIRREAMFHPELEVVIRSGDDSNERQIEDIRWFQNEGFDLIIAAPNEADALTPVIKEVYDAGTPVIIFDRRINGKSYTAFIGADNLTIGANAAKYAHSLVDGQCRAIEICGLEGSTPAIARRDGFDTMAAQLGIEIVGQGDGQWNRSMGAVVADSLLRVHPEANVIFAHNDHMAIAAGEVARHLHRYDIRIIGVDAAPSVGMQAVKDGKIDATFIYPTEGYTLVRTALDILEGNPFQRDNLVGIPSAVTQDNAEILLQQNTLMQEETAKIEQLQESLAISLREHAMQNILMWSAIVVALLLIGILAYIVYNARVKARQRSEIEYQRDELHDLHSVISELQDVVDSVNQENAFAAMPPPAASNATQPLQTQPESGAEQEAQSTTPANQTTEADETFLNHFNDFVHKNMSNSNLSVVDIAAEMGMSRVQLYRRIKGLTGNSPVEILRIRRMSHADHLIRTSGMTIAEIAYAVGLTSPSYFTKCYHEYFNRLPTDVLRIRD